MHGVDRATGGIGRDRHKERGIGDAEAHVLAFHVAAGLQCARRLVDMERGEGGIARRLGGIDDGDAGEEQDAHDGEDRQP